MVTNETRLSSPDYRLWYRFERVCFKKNSKRSQKRVDQSAENSLVIGSFELRGEIYTLANYQFAQKEFLPCPRKEEAE